MTDHDTMANALARYARGVASVAALFTDDATIDSAALYGADTHTWTRTGAGWRIRTLRFERHCGTGTFLGPDEITLFSAGAR